MAGLRRSALLLNKAQSAAVQEMGIDSGDARQAGGRLPSGLSARETAV